MRSHSLLPPALVVLMAAAGLAPFAQTLDERAVDIFRRNHAPHPDIAIIAIDNESLSTIGRWPWSRKTHAQLLDTLRASPPRAIGFDINFSEPENPQSDASFSTAIQNIAVPVILPIQEVISSTGSPLGSVKPLPALRTTNVSLGHVTVPVSADGIARPMPRPAIIQGEAHPSFAAQVARSIGGGDLAASHAWIDFAGPAGTFPTYSYHDVLAGRIPAEAMQDKILLIGATAGDLHDVVLPPFEGAMAGVEWQANVLDTILRGTPIRPVPRAAVLCLGLLIAGGLWTVTRRASIGRSLSATLAALALLPFISFAAWRMGYALPYAWNILLVLLGFLATAFERWYVTDREKRQMRRTLQPYFSPVVMDSILQDPEAINRGERKEITVLFSDIRSFTTITESSSPEVLQMILREYFTAMTAEIFKTEGVLCHFIGDAILAFWGAPLPQEDHPERAVRTAIEMMRSLRTLQPQWAARGLPHIDIGIGINTGMATIGNLGSQERFDYTVIGDCVNAAARLESLNKEHKTHILISQSTEERLPATLSRREVGDIVVKGKTKSLKVFEVAPEVQ
jgi:adenylate cyclase